jgi:tetratricopeptide (TPR) repeat protein
LICVSSVANLPTGPVFVVSLAEMLAAAFQHLQAGNTSEAEERYRAILRAQPSHADAWFFLGTACQMKGKLQEAQLNYRRALALSPDHASAYYNLGVALEQQDQLAEAAGCYQQALRIEPTNLAALNNLGNVLKALGKLDNAIACYREVLRLKPDFAEVHANLGNVLSDQENLVEAESSYRRALQLRPDYAEVHYNLGILFSKWGKIEDAIAYYRRALSFKPSYQEAHVNLGNVLRLTGQMEEALTSFQQALHLKPDFASAHWNRSMVLLARGDFQEGWPEYEWRWAQHNFARRHFVQPLWDGANLHGKTLLLYAEQGLGDTLHFIRYAPLVKQRGGKVLLECQPQLLRLLAAFPGIDQLLPRGSQLPSFDIQAPLLSLPGIFHTHLGSIPATVPYMRAAPELVGHWRRKLSEVRNPRSEVKTTSFSDIGQRTSDFGRLFLIGIAWQGNPTNPGDRHRSIPLVFFRRLAEVPGVQLISLQKGPGTEQLSVAGSLLSDNRQLTTASSSVFDFGSALDDATGAFADTAAVMMNLDLVISSDTVIPHLAGALGVPVWLALSLAPDWRWLLHREDSPWYPNIRLFRQKMFGDWQEVFDRIGDELRKLATDETPMKRG